MLIIGRISSEMLCKAAKMYALGPDLVDGSRHGLTKNAILAARDTCIAMVGQVRGERLAVLPTRSGLAVQQIKFG
ncbi:formate dehydrogenase accessory sulfurtransferase FdhD [Sporotomaculum syntrophicum]|uniref:formate dehydrogenase accessory sulfurtransferase FdhD n=1 Tax=Sporotomaculum syntrophicum TaxID=182264 RepID=UPI001FAB3ED3|nr:hypothetical protein [Sporotomaculum syntrophicum]